MMSDAVFQPFNAEGLSVFPKVNQGVMKVLLAGAVEMRDPGGSRQVAARPLQPRTSAPSRAQRSASITPRSPVDQFVIRRTSSIGS